MKLVLFAVRDIVTNQTGFIFPAKNDKDLRRSIKGGIMSKSPVFAENMADKQILQVGLLHYLSLRGYGCEDILRCFGYRLRPR